MRRLIQEELEAVFLAPGVDYRSLSTAWVIINHAEHEGGIELHQALERVRKQSYEVSIFADKILQSGDLDDVVYVIDKLVAETEHKNIWSRECLRMLQAWRARTLMQVVIDKRNVAQRDKSPTLRLCRFRKL